MLIAGYARDVPFRVVNRTEVIGSTPLTTATRTLNLPTGPWVMRDSVVAVGNRVVIGGAGGFMGAYLVERYRRAGREVVTIGRSGADLCWGDTDGIAQAVDGAELVIGLAGKSVNCRYSEANRAEIFRSRLETTAELSRAILAAKTPPSGSILRPPLSIGTPSITR